MGMIYYSVNTYVVNYKDSPANRSKGGIGMIKFRSINTKILSAIIPLLTVFFLLLSFVGYTYINTLLNDEISEKMRHQLDSTANNIGKTLIQHSRIAESTARVAGALGNSASKDTYVSILSGVLGVNDDTFGAGVWFEPYVYEGVQYFGPYVYKDGGNLVTTFDYEKPDYDFHNQEWYTIGKSTAKLSVYTAPYYDELTNITMVTTNAPIYGKDKKFLGVVTSDIDLSSLQKFVSGLKVGKGGSAVLLMQDGTYMVDRDATKVMKQKISEDKNSSLAEMGKVIIQKKTGEASYTDANGMNIVQFTTIPSTDWILALSIPESELHENLNNLLLRLGLFVLVVLLLVGLAVLLLGRSLKKQTNAVNVFSAAMAEGIFNTSIPVTSVDEIGQMAGNLNTAVAKLRDLLAKVKISMSEVTDISETLSIGVSQNLSAIDQITESIQDVSAGQEKQTSLIDSSSAASEKTLANIESIAAKMNEVTAAAGNASSRAENGSHVVSQAVVQMNTINDRVGAISEGIKTLNEKSGKIGDIVSTITAIASQTNLLALNAAIEAARAGESGRGFAVVADEVRKLAEQSGEAANNITVLISDIQEEVQSSSYDMGIGVAAVNDGMTMIKNVGESFNEINHSVIDISSEVGMVSEVLKSVVAQTQVMVGAVESILKISEQATADIQNIAASTEEQNALMRELSETAQKMSEITKSVETDLDKFTV